MKKLFLLLSALCAASSASAMGFAGAGVGYFLGDGLDYYFVRGGIELPTSNDRLSHYIGGTILTYKDDEPDADDFAVDEIEYLPFLVNYYSFYDINETLDLSFSAGVGGVRLESPDDSDLTYAFDVGLGIRMQVTDLISVGLESYFLYIHEADLEGETTTSDSDIGIQAVIDFHF